MKILKKVFTAIGHFFRNIWRYIMTNAWIQPILIVALIFAIIFGLTGIPKVIDYFEGLFDSSTDSKIKKQKKIDYDEFMEMYNNNETFFIVFGGDECMDCKTLYKNINTYMDDEEHKEIVDSKIYFMNVTDLIEDVNDDIEKYGDIKFADEGENFKKLETLANLLHSGYADILKSWTNTDYSEYESYGKTEAAYGIMTPTTAFFTSKEGAEHSEMFNMVVGQWSYTQGYSDINRLFECWHLSTSDWDSAVSERESLREHYNG